MTPAATWPRGPIEGADGGFAVTVTDELCGAGGWLYGGFGMGLLVDAAQAASQQRLHGLSVNFLRPIARHARLRLQCKRLAAGRALGHYRVDAFVEGELVMAGTAVTGPALGPASGVDQADVAASPPPAAPAEKCPERPYLMPPGTGVSLLLDVRTAGERLDAGVASTMLLWGRLRCDASDEARLAALSDHVPYLLRRAFPALTRANTVSASLRVFGAPVTDWVLFELSLVSLTARIAVGRVNLWSAGTRLVAVGEQTARLSTS